MLPRTTVLRLECFVPFDAFVPSFPPAREPPPPCSPARMRAMTFHGFASSAAMSSSRLRRCPSRFHHQLTITSARNDATANDAYTSMKMPASLSAVVLGDGPVPERVGIGAGFDPPRPLAAAAGDDVSSHDAMCVPA